MFASVTNTSLLYLGMHQYNCFPCRYFKYLLKHTDVLSIMCFKYVKENPMQLKYGISSQHMLQYSAGNYQNLSDKLKPYCFPGKTLSYTSAKKHDNCRTPKREKTSETNDECECFIIKHS